MGLSRALKPANFLLLGLRQFIDLNIDFITKNVSSSTLRCHFDDGSFTGQQATQDCLLDRFNLCAKSMEMPGSGSGFDFMACTYRNQRETATTDDNQFRFNATIQYCAQIAGFGDLGACARGLRGEKLLAESHIREQATNTNVDQHGHHHNLWIQVNDVLITNSSQWLSSICKTIPSQQAPPACRQ